MAKKIEKILSLLLVAALINGVFLFNVSDLKVSALTESYYTYEISNNEATITKADKSISGAITLPATLGGYPLTKIGNNAFDGCNKMTKIVIPDSVVCLGDRVFSSCSLLNEIIIPDSIERIGELAFYGTGYSNNQDNWEDGFLYIGNHLAEVGNLVGNYKIKSGTKVIVNRAFLGCNKLEALTIPDSVKNVGYSQFQNCDNMVIYCNKNSAAGKYCNIYLKESSANEAHYVYIDGNDQESIINGSVGKFDWTLDKRTGVLKLKGNGEIIDFNTGKVTKSAPWYNYRAYITSIELPSKLTKIGNNAFKGCYRLKKVKIPSGVKSIGENAFSDCKKIDSIALPSKIENIGKEAFSGCALKELKIPDSIKSIGSGAFSGCLIESFEIPKKLKSIDGLFSGWSKLKKIVFSDNLTSIGNKAFYGCSNLESIKIPKGIKSIGEQAFSYCSKLKKVEIPSTVKSIGAWAFNNCNLSSITIPNNVTSIGNYAFFECQNLKTVKISDSVVNIGAYAFKDCKNLENITIGKSVTKIESYLFQRNEKIKSLTLPASVKTICNKAFYGSAITEVVIYNKKCEIRGECGLSYENTIYGYKGSTAEKYANEIGAKFIDIKPLHKHTYKSVTTTSTLSKDGKVEQKCDMCGYVKSSKKIKRIKSVKLSTTNYTYNGKTKKPSVTVKDTAGKKLKKNTDYTVTVAKSSKNVGSYKVTVKFKGKYSGTVTKTFKINPKSTKISKVTAKVKSLKVTVSKQTKQVTGYEIQYSTSKKFKSAKKLTIKKDTTTSATIKKLKAKKTYYVRVRTYKTVGKTKYYSSWSTYKYKKTK